MLAGLRACVAANDPDRIEARAVVDHPEHYPAQRGQEARAGRGLPDPLPATPSLVHADGAEGAEGADVPNGEAIGELDVGGIF